MTAFVPSPPSELEAIDDLLDGDDRRPRRQHGFLLHPDDALDEHVAGAVGLLRVHDRDVGPVRGHRRQALAGERTGDELDVRVHLGEIGSEVAAEEGRRHAGGAGGVGVRHRGVAVLLDLERPRPAALDGVAQAMERADAGIAAPREHQLARAAAPDHLVVQEVRRHAHERQIGNALPDDLVPGGKRDEVGKTLERDALAGTHESRDGVGKRRERAHASSVKLRMVPRCSSRPGSSWPRAS